MYTFSSIQLPTEMEKLSYIALILFLLLSSIELSKEPFEFV